MAADGDQGLDTDQKIRRSAARTLLNWVTGLAALGVIAGWGSTGVYYTQPGEAAVVLHLGRYYETVRDEGLHWRFPAPLGYHDTINVSEVRRLEFGLGSEGFEADRDAEPIHEHEVQTSDSNIVIPRYVVQYKIGDAFTYLYSLKDPTRTLKDASQAAMREAIGRYGIDEVLASNRQGIEEDAKRTLEAMVARYARKNGGATGFEILSMRLQSVQPPPKVQAAFDDVVAAKQDKDRALSVAAGDADEIRERAGAQAVELRESARAYKDAKVIEASGEAKRFELLLAEYQNARGVTRRRLYFETMESFMQGVEMFVVEPDAVQLMPLLSLPNQSLPGTRATSGDGEGR